MARHNIIGKLGEKIAAKYLITNGHTIVSVNYTKKWGEIDIISHETNTIHFIEVKTVSYETKEKLNYAVSHETWRPEDNVHKEKQKRFARTIETWLLENNYEGKWHIDIVTVRVVPESKFAKIKIFKDIIFE